MNNIFYRKLVCAFALAAGILLCSSCEDWLKATSISRIPADDMFGSRTGFHEALSGVYIAMGDLTCYGGYDFWYLNNITAYPYQSSNLPEFKELQDHEYSSVRIKSLIEAMWAGNYNVIANINMILRALDERRDVVTSDLEYNLIKGELLALRAYIHFDLMRMFGVNDWSGENAAKLTVPYVTEYSAVAVEQKSYEKTAKLLSGDIEEALSCLQASDPVLGELPKDFDSGLNVDGYWSNRAKHMNYYAALALAAKVYQWTKDYPSALECAGKVAEGAFAGGLVSWVNAEALLHAETDDNLDWIYSTEHIFSLEVTGLYDRLSPYFFPAQSVGGFCLLIDEAFVRQLFPMVDYTSASPAGAEDIRGTALQLKYSASGYSLNKYYGSTYYYSGYRNRIPMLRISEMYYIMAEAMMMSGKNAEARAYIDEVRSHRGITSSLPQDSDVSDVLLEEYHREFVGEDKLFYYLKHINARRSLSVSFALKADNLIYPYPDAELDYGRKQEL